MDTTTGIVIALGLMALVLVVFFSAFRGKGKFRIKNPLGEVSAEGKNETPHTVPTGIKAGKIDSGGNAQVHSAGEGGIDVGDVRATKDVSITQGQQPPKK